MLKSFEYVGDTLLNHLECHSHLQARGMRLAGNMEGGQLAYGMNDCELNQTAEILS